MNTNIFEQAAQQAAIWTPYENNILILPAGKRMQNSADLAGLPRYPALFVTDLGYVPHATKMEILRRKAPNLFIVGGRDEISEWVEYILTTFTAGKVYRIIPSGR